MVLSATDQTDIVLGLFGGLLAADPWEAFLRRLLARSAAQRVLLTAGGQTCGAAARGAQDEAAERAALDGLRSMPLRAGRVYALEELLDFDDAARRARQGALLDVAGIGDARLIRIDAGEDRQVEIALLHAKASLGAADSALLTGLVPAVAVAAGMVAAMAADRARLAAAEDALGRLGIGQALLDQRGQVIAADPVWQGTAPGGAPLAEACAVVAGGAAAATVRPGDAGGQAVFVRRGAKPGSAVGAVRRARNGDAAAAGRVIAAEMGLSPREADLAALLAQGHGLIEAGRLLRLTGETARNYSKRIYAKTGARGQADLVRLVLGGLAVLA